MSDEQADSTVQSTTALNPEATAGQIKVVITMGGTGNSARRDAKRLKPWECKQNRGGCNQLPITDELKKTLANTIPPIVRTKFESLGLEVAPDFTFAEAFALMIGLEGLGIKLGMKLAWIKFIVDNVQGTPIESPHIAEGHVDIAARHGIEPERFEQLVDLLQFGGKRLSDPGPETPAKLEQTRKDKADMEMS